MERHQQRYPPLPQAVDVTVQSPRGHWPGKTIDLCPSGATVTWATKSIHLPLGTVVQLRVAVPDGNSPLSLPARVVETSADGVSLSFFNLRDQAQRLKDLFGSLFPQESERLLHQLGPDRPLNSEAEVLPQPSVPPEFIEEARPAEPAEELELAEPKEQPVPLSDIPSEQGRWEGLLRQVGLDRLSLPSNGVLTRQWLDFLEQLGASNDKTGKTYRGKIVRANDEQPRRAPKDHP